MSRSSSPIVLLTAPLLVALLLALLAMGASAADGEGES